MSSVPSPYLQSPTLGQMLRLVNVQGTPWIGTLSEKSDTLSYYPQGSSGKDPHVTVQSHMGEMKAHYTDGTQMVNYPINLNTGVVNGGANAPPELRAFVQAYPIAARALSDAQLAQARAEGEAARKNDPQLTLMLNSSEKPLPNKAPWLKSNTGGTPQQGQGQPKPDQTDPNNGKGNPPRPKIKDTALESLA